MEEEQKHEDGTAEMRRARLLLYDVGQQEGLVQKVAPFCAVTKDTVRKVANEGGCFTIIEVEDLWYFGG